MIRHPYGPDELDRDDPALDEVAEQLQAYASDQRSVPPVDLAARIHAAVDAEPDPPVGWWATFTAAIGGLGTPARGLAAAAVVTSAIVLGLFAGDLADLIRDGDGTGASPSPSVIVPPSPSPSPSASPSPSPTTSPSPSDSPTPPQRSATPAPTATDDETPEPTESDNSGPGGGDGDNSGPGGGDGDNSGPGGGGDSGSDD
jgi:uncharacterized membrane protein YgcG